MRIVKWDKYDGEKYPSFDDVDEYQEAEEIVIEEIKKNGYLFHGYYHQNGEHGCPVFDNGKQFRTTFRAWGSIMQEAHPELIGGGNGYIIMAWDFHCKHLEHLFKYPQ